MTDLSPDGAGPDLQLAVSSVLANNRDTRLLMRVLGANLADTLGDRVEVERTGGGLLHRKPEEVSRIVVHLDPDEYVAHLDGHAVRCSVQRSSGGVRIRSEQLPVEQWLHRLLAALAAEATENQSARQALESIVVGGQP